MVESVTSTLVMDGFITVVIAGFEEDILSIADSLPGCTFMVGLLVRMDSEEGIVESVFSMRDFVKSLVSIAGLTEEFFSICCVEGCSVLSGWLVGIGSREGFIGSLVSQIKFVRGLVSKVGFKETSDSEVVWLKGCTFTVLSLVSLDSGTGDILVSIVRLVTLKVELLVILCFEMGFGDALFIAGGFGCCLPSIVECENDLVSGVYMVEGFSSLVGFAVGWMAIEGWLPMAEFVGGLFGMKCFTLLLSCSNEESKTKLLAIVVSLLDFLSCRVSVLDLFRRLVSIISLLFVKVPRLDLLERLPSMLGVLGRWVSDVTMPGSSPTIPSKLDFLSSKDSSVSWLCNFV